jgi:hypothetical protein
MNKKRDVLSINYDNLIYKDFHNILKIKDKYYGLNGMFLA